MPLELLESVLENGVANSHYFNGRILTADALRDDQNASRRQRQQLGKAIGKGVVCGLTVQQVIGSNPPVLRITAGLAINGQGQALELPQDVDLTLARERDIAAASAGLFAACLPLDSGEYVTGRNVYVLAMAPASGYREKAPLYDLSSSNGNGRSAGCGYRYAVEGVQFRLVEVDLEDTDVISGAAKTAVDDLVNAEPQDAPTLSKLRNLLAHICLGTTEVDGFTADLFSQLAYGTTAKSYGLLSRITDSDPAQADEYTLTPCDVPLALLYWTTAGLQWVDMWSVRRRVVRPTAATSGDFLVSDRRTAEGEAAFLQFQTQAAYLSRPAANAGTVNAINYFDYLPAAGIIPLANPTGGSGFAYLNFFAGLTTRQPVFIEGAKVGHIMRRSFNYQPTALNSGEFLWLYQVRQNIQAGDQNPLKPPQPYLIFTSGHMPFFGDAQYDLARWDYANYGPVVGGNPTGG